MKRKQHDPAPSLTVELAPLYRCGTKGRRYLTKHGAYMAEASRILHAIYHGGRELCRKGKRVYPWAPEQRAASLWTEQDWIDARNRDELFVRRLARWLRWRDGRRAAAMEQS